MGAELCAGLATHLSSFREDQSKRVAVNFRPAHSSGLGQKSTSNIHVPFAVGTFVEKTMTIAQTYPTFHVACIYLTMSMMVVEGESVVRMKEVLDFWRQIST